MPEDTQLISLAEDAYEATVDCISAIATEHIQQFGNAYRLLKSGSAAQALSLYLQRVHALGRTNDLDVLEETTDAEVETHRLFPKTATSAGPRAALLALVKLAKTYQLFIVYVKKLQESGAFIEDVKNTLAELQLVYDSVCDWEPRYAIISSLKDRNHIVTIGGLVFALERELQTAQTRVLKKG